MIPHGLNPKKSISVQYPVPELRSAAHDFWYTFFRMSLSRKLFRNVFQRMFKHVFGQFLTNQIV